LIKRIVAYKTLAGAIKKQAMEDILSINEAPQRVYAMVFGDEQRACLRVLVDACRKEKPRQVLMPLIVHDVDRLLAISDDKARKTASMLIGLVAPDACADAMREALLREQTRFVRPSMILALGNTEAPQKYLDGYTIEPGADKHVREETDALKKALAKTQKPQELGILNLPMWCALTSVNRSALRAELEEKKCRFNNKSALPGAIDALSADTHKLRCYMDALYHIGEIGAYKSAAEKLNAIGCSGFSYRIEAGAYRPEQRRDLIRSVSEGMAKFGYSDNPSAYAFEIRLKSGGMYAVFPQNGRFSYRKQAIPASIHPVTAASVVQICKPYMKENAAVLDPFCGSATLLIERGLAGHTESLVGVDISPFAIKAACANRAVSGLKIALIKSDILSYGAARYDEILSNMPFGIRVSDHKTNVTLYNKFIAKMTTLLKDDGMAFLYTQEKKLLRDVIAAKSGFSIVKEMDFNAGGLCPTLFIIKRG